MESFLAIVGSTFIIMLIAEFGDKTNLIALSIMTSSNRPYFVAILSTIGIALSTILSVILGMVLGDVIPFELVRYSAAVIFIILGILSLTEEENELEPDTDGVPGDIEIENDREQSAVKWYSPVYLVFLAEFGDKSQIFVITASASTSAGAVFIGSILGMGAIMFATAAVGSVLVERLDEELLEKLGGLLFIAAGIWIGLTTLLN